MGSVACFSGIAHRRRHRRRRTRPPPAPWSSLVLIIVADRHSGPPDPGLLSGLINHAEFHAQHHPRRPNTSAGQSPPQILWIASGPPWNRPRGPSRRDSGVLGQSGTGKSVLLKLIIGLEKPDTGIHEIAGRDIARLSRDELNGTRKKMGLPVPAGRPLWIRSPSARTCGFPLAPPQPILPIAQRRDRVRELLSKAAGRRPSTKSVRKFSEECRKRVGLARALALDPELILFDEPTAGLRSITADEIDRLIADLKKQHQAASIVVTHDIHRRAPCADRVVMLARRQRRIGRFRRRPRKKQGRIYRPVPEDRGLGDDYDQRDFDSAGSSWWLSSVLAPRSSFIGQREPLFIGYRLDTNIRQIVAVSKKGAPVRVGASQGDPEAFALPLKPGGKSGSR